ncbi:ubiquitin-conjugating enzyme [Xylariaceae sp. FL0594]|nr:ubiquitin-conjugating enzyme [Xylariaceae sp. FL0594]
MSSRSSPTKRLLRELSAWEKERETEDGIERLGPVSEDELLRWEAVINGKGVGSGYDAGRWLLTIVIPPTYPLAPPAIKFATEIVHANIGLKTGEICLDLLKDAWTPAYSVLECVRAVRMLLSCPEVDSPLNVDVAALLRNSSSSSSGGKGGGGSGGGGSGGGGGSLAARRLVEYWCQDERGRYDGP